MKPRYSISIHFANVLVNASRRRGLDCAAVIEAVGLSDDLLSNPQVRITPEQFSQLMQGLWQLGDDELLGLGSLPSRYGVFSLMAKQVVYEENLLKVLKQSSRFYTLTADAVQFSIQQMPGAVRLELTLKDPSRDPDNALVDLLLLIWHRFPSWLVGQTIPLKCVCLMQAKPAYADEYRLMFPCDTLFNQAGNWIEFDSTAMNWPVVQTRQALSDYLRRAPLDWFRRQAYYPIYARRVLDYLVESGVSTSMEEVAIALHVTTRTLRRKLTDEGTSFQELKDGVRRDSAIHHLSSHELSIAQIARLVGFSEPAAFTRAFKQWTGVAPGMYRRSASR